MSTVPMLYSKISGLVRWSEGTIVLRKGQSIDGDHALAAERPDLFTETEPGAEIPSRVQTGLQRPGESRMERVTPPRVVQAPPRGSK